MCTRGSNQAPARGRSTSPLEGLFGRRAGRELVVLPGHSFEEPFVYAAVGSVASVAELHCLMNRSGITVAVAAADADVAPLRGREHCASVASFVAALRSTSELRAGAR